MNAIQVRGEASEPEIAAVVAALTGVLQPRPDPLSEWRRQRRQALGMRRGG